MVQELHTPVDQGPESVPAVRQAVVRAVRRGAPTAVSPTSGPAARRDRRREILAAAARAFRRQGFHGTGMRAIAADLGMTVGNLYYYFESKQALLAFCHEQTLSHLEALRERVAQADGGVADRLYRWIVGHVRCLLEGTPGSVAHLEVSSLPAAARARLQDRRDRYEKALRLLIEEGVRAGELRAADPRVAALTILDAANGTTRWYREDGPCAPAEIGRLQARQLVSGLLPEGSRWREPEPSTVPTSAGVEPTSDLREP